MNILLISTPSYSTLFPIGNMPNLGLLSIASNLTGNHNIKILESFNKKTHFINQIKNTIDTLSPDVIGISAMTFQYETAKIIAKYIKKEYPVIKTVLGGYHATTMYEEIYESDDKFYFDFIVRNEGEKTFDELIISIENKLSFDNIMGLSYFDGVKVQHNKQREPLDLKEIKIPNRNFINKNDFSLFNPLQMKNQGIMLIETSRGCTNTCNFCVIRNMYQNSFRTYDLDRVIEDIINVRKSDIKMIFVVDDNICLDVERLKQLCKLIIEKKLNDIIYIVQCSSKGIATSEELSYLMSKAGFTQVFLGIENNENKNLKYLNKGNIINYTNLAIKYLHKNNIRIYGGLIIGLPEDDKKSIDSLFKFIENKEIDYPFIQIVTPYPKTKIRESYKKMNLITNETDFTKYDGYWANIRTKHLTSYELEYYKILKLKKNRLLKFNLNFLTLRTKPLLFLKHLFINPISYLIWEFSNRNYKKYFDNLVEELEKESNYYNVI
ncbi:MAG: hypothetical protein A2086_02460 [Spirochaetes bacterium GWD1_27_9]|nr:MAG: hypothetical protein A2Z98_03535 [Spirochaetes bacterium GWB1_27_13]OHD27167.1 MAG: hypothetical protein A2Y34_16120 [Spirochaetes bacterium GWC1_27_15]OHD30439.1 MAG: hypothetical protein A2086_02460 [Spirochaetes bacterium GWD1_27_9]